MIDHFNRVTNSLMENALFELVEMWENFWMQLSNGINVEEQFSVGPITFEQFRYLLLVPACFWTSYTLVFVCEIIWFHIQRIGCRTIFNRCKNRLIMTVRSVVHLFNRFQKAIFNCITRQIRKLFRK